MTNTRLVAIAYVVLALAAGLFLEHVLLAVFGGFGPTQPLTRPLVGDWTWSTVIGLGACAATIAVIVASVIAAVLLGLFDVFWQFLTDKIQNPSI